MAYTTIDDPSAHFYTYAFSKSSGTGSVTFDANSDLQPDFLWVKSRSNADSHELWDSTRGVNSTLFSDSTSAQDTAANRIVSFDTDGFTWGNAGNLNAAGDFVSWAWKANGGTTSTNTDGDINSTVQVNSDAGFSIVSYQPTNTTSRNIGHGLGVIPGLIIIRNRTRIENWRLWHKSIGQGGAILDSTATYNAATSTLVNTVTSTYFNVGGDFSVNGNYPYIAYCFAEKQGFSKFGKYVGNGSTNGTFVYTGFKPAFVMTKNTSATDSWVIMDEKRSPSNVANKYLLPNTSGAEGTNFDMFDFVSNGFKCRRSTSQNASGNTFIYMAFAENPFVTSTSIPTTAR